MDRFLLLLQAHHLPAPETEVRFHPTRKFRADYLWRAQMVIVEVNGQIWRKGGHNTGKGLLRDYEKANAAQVLGFIYLQFTPQQVETAACLAVLKQVLQ